MQTFQKENDSVQREETLTEKYKNETEHNKGEIHSLENNTQEFRGTICDSCRQTLQLPAVYFLCKHSFHQE